MSTPRKIILTDREIAKDESFLEGSFEVRSRSGIHLTERLLIERLPQLRRPEKVLFLENRSAVGPIVVGEKFPLCSITIHHLDCFYTDKLSELLKSNNFQRAEVICSAELPGEEESYDAIFLQVTQSISAELVADYLQQIHNRLKTGGQCWISAEKKNSATLDQVKKVFGGISQENVKGARLFVAKKRSALKKIKKYSASFSMTLPGGVSIPVQSRPGVFGHRSVDGGAQALAEAVIVEDGDRILELGCGSGVVGISAALRAKDCTLKLVDSSSRAIACAQENAELNNLEPVTCELSSSGVAEKKCYSLFLGNPPYFSDHKISGLFIDVAAQTLIPGGRAYIVAKKMEWNLEYARDKFTSVEVFKRREYLILRCVK